MVMRVLLVVVVLLFSGCGERTDTETLAIAESLSIADLEIESGTRLRTIAVAGRPDSGFPSWASVGQVYEPHGDDPIAVKDELRRLVEAEGWIIEQEGENNSWVTAEREVEGRTFSANAGFSPQAGTVSLWIEESPRNTGSS